MKVPVTLKGVRVGWIAREKRRTGWRGVNIIVSIMGILKRAPRPLVFCCNKGEEHLPSCHVFAEDAVDLTVECAPENLKMFDQGLGGYVTAADLVKIWALQSTTTPKERRVAKKFLSQWTGYQMECDILSSQPEEA